MIWSLALVAPAVAQESSDEEAKELYAKGEEAYADEEYEQERFASDIVGQVVALQGNPRTYGVTLNYSF